MVLRLIVFGGEALTLSDLRPWFKHHREPHLQLINMYGITETTIHVTYQPISSKDLNMSGSIIGAPIPDLQIYILDQSMQPVPVNVPGEIYVGGAGLARGYLNSPRLTAERFLPNPFLESYEGAILKNEEAVASPISLQPAAGGRKAYTLYRTGDLARLLTTGNMEYLGRIDHQVKLRGFRIELGEIESLLSQHSAVKETVVIVREDTPDSKQLIAYFTTEPGHRTPTANQIRQFLTPKLPNYMIPSAYVPISNLPLTPNGKLDRRKLPMPKGDRPHLDQAYRAPATKTEQIMASVWKEVLNLDSVGIYDSFFDLGGNSFLMVQVHTQLQERLHQEFSVAEMFNYPTIDALTSYLSETRAETEEQQQSTQAKRLNRGKTRLQQRLKQRQQSRK